MRVLTVNAGSSSLKLRLLEDDDAVVLSADLGHITETQASPDLDRFVAESEPLDAVGHRVVNGGDDFRGSVVVTDDVFSRLSETAKLAPLHNPPALAALAATRRLTSAVPHVVCFDTIFHADMPPAAAAFAIPERWSQGLGVRRYGFHGLSHAYASRRCSDLLQRRLEDMRIVTCHLGAGASIAAVASGRSVDTTMGFTPLDGLVMATRSGSVDPGAILWIQQNAGVSAADMERALEAESGLLALCGSSDMRDVLRRADEGDERARFAIDVYVHRLRACIAAMTAAMGGADTLAFTGGVGEHATTIRRDACAGLGFLGVALDSKANENVDTDDCILSSSNGTTAVALVHAREDIEIAREVRRLIG